MDGHKSHFCPDMIKTAAKEGVILFALPPHTTHLCQPLAKGSFAPLKVEWQKAVQRFISEQRGREVTIYDFNTVFKDAWYNALTANNILAGFRITGVFPFNRNAVKQDHPSLRSLTLNLFPETLRLLLFLSLALSNLNTIRALKTLKRTPMAMMTMMMPFYPRCCRSWALDLIDIFQTVPSINVILFMLLNLEASKSS